MDFISRAGGGGGGSCGNNTSGFHIYTLITFPKTSTAKIVSVIIKTCRIWRERRWISFLEPEEPEELEEVVQRQERLKQCQLRVEPVVALKMLPAQPQVEETPGGGETRSKDASQLWAHHHFTKRSVRRPLSRGKSPVFSNKSARQERPPSPAKPSVPSTTTTIDSFSSIKS